MVDQTEALDHTTAVYGLAAEVGVGGSGSCLTVGCVRNKGGWGGRAESPCAPGESGCKLLGLHVSASCCHFKGRFGLQYQNISGTVSLGGEMPSGRMGHTQTGCAQTRDLHFKYHPSLCRAGAHANLC